MTDHVIQISKDATKLSVVPDPTNTKTGDTVKWGSNEPEFELTFEDGTPFVGGPSAGVVKIPHQEATQPQPIRDVSNDPNYNQRKRPDGTVAFKYAVTAGGITLDPDIVTEGGGP